MKKAFLAFLLAGTMALGCSSFAMAEESTIDIDEIMSELQDVEVTEETYSGKILTWDDIDQIDNAEEIVSKGSFVEEESIGIKYFVPDFMEELELDDADKESGIIRFFWNGDNATFHIQVMDAGDVTNDIDYLKALEASGDFDPMLLTVNDIDTVVYFIESEDEETPDMMCIAYIPEGTGSMILFSYGPTDDEFQDYFNIMVASIQKIEEE